MYIYSTLSNPQEINQFCPQSVENQAPKKLKSVRIEGRANVAPRNIIWPVNLQNIDQETFDLNCPRVTETQVSEQDFEFLMGHPSFKHWVKEGFVSYDKKRRLDYRNPKTVDLIVKDMQKKSKTAALTADSLDKMPNGVKESMFISDAAFNNDAE